MVWKHRHLTDERILRMIDGELSIRRTRRTQQHLTACVECRQRIVDLETSLADLRRDSRMAVDPLLPPAGPSRARLKRRMTESLDGSATWQTPGDFRRTLTHGTWLQAGGVLIVLGALFYGQQSLPRLSPTADDLTVFVVPRQDLTPGAARLVTADAICGPARRSRTQPIPAEVHRRVFAGYGADYRRAAEYELDYLVTPELGGLPDPRNLWPQPFAGTPWNAYVKDELELLFHRLVCEGVMDVREAQRQMAADWVSAYKRHFHTDKPRRDYAHSPVTAFDKELLLSELEELGMSAPPRADGAALVAMLRAGRNHSVGQLTQRVNWLGASPVGLRLIGSTVRIRADMN